MFFLAVWAGAGPRPDSKKNTRPPPPKNIKKRARPRPVHHLATAKNEIQKTKPQKKTHTHTHSRPNRVFCCLGRDGAGVVWLSCCCFCFFCCAVTCFTLCLPFGRGVCFLFAVWARVVFNFCCLGTDGSSLTYRSAWLDLRGGQQQKKQTAKNEKMVPIGGSE